MVVTKCRKKIKSRLLQIDQCSICNGPGFRTVVWLTGCPHHCEGCQNPQTASYFAEGSHTFTDKDWDVIYQVSNHDYIAGITISGGDPLYEVNVNTTMEIASRFKKSFPDKDVWVYTGYTMEELEKRGITASMLKDSGISVVVDGEFIKELKTTTSPFIGSTNQRIIRLENYGV